MVTVLNISGLVANLVGVIILFRFGMPFHVPSGGAIHIIIEQTDDTEIAKERIYKVWGYVGLALIVGGTALQIGGALNA